ncbi:MAG TPA: acyl-CoA dehydrogenase family protein [Acidimicrobiales bacterium]|jgi:alkylation response protein AidB-like acyl-CoA dehydrogenase|nr:acyl-CoA dehydrogenase family protein [Acidimicrobiales bacterium]
MAIDDDIDTAPLIEKLITQLLEEHPPATTDRSTFLGARFDLGLSAVHFPPGCGGLGLNPRVQSVVEARLGAAGAPSSASVNPIGVGMAAPTLATHGTDAQRARYLRPLFTGEEVWCQLFSEPGSGSDLAGLSTRAQLDGDEWVVNGQKVWTSLGHLAHFGILLARTNPDVPKHRGLTYFVVDMTVPEVDVRPLFQMTGDAEFNEVFLTDLRIPDSDRIGGTGDGWRVGLTTLMNERVLISGGVEKQGEGMIAPLVSLYRERGGPGLARQRVAALWVRAEVLRMTNLRATARRSTGTPGPEGSIGKLANTELRQDIHAATIDLLGMEGTLYPTGYRKIRSQRSGEAPSRQQGFLRSRANSIEGGTTEIMKNILAERILGLPGDVRVDKELAWADVPRS